ncbi:MAG: antitoxin, RHH family protein [Endomicrobiia bacterium]|nr:antitoxin, RHH family protein [Endomicrobiia bacterium]
MTSKTLVVLEPPVRSAVEKIARREHLSVSGVCRELIKESLEIYEDSYFAAGAASREDGFNWRGGSLSHDSVWGRRK